MVIAPSFADIFYGNSFNNQLLPVTLSDAQVDEMFALVKANPGIKFEVDLEAQVVKAGDKSYSFKIDDFRRHCMLNGLDSQRLCSNLFRWSPHGGQPFLFTYNVSP